MASIRPADALVALAGCGEVGLPDFSTHDPAVAELSQLHNLLFEAEDLESLLEHFADPFSTEIVMTWLGDDTEISGQVSHDDVLQSDPEDMAAQWIAYTFPIVIDYDDFLEITIGEPVVEVNRTTATVTQTIQGDILFNSEQYEQATFHQTVTIASTWSKETGEWLLTHLSISVNVECVSNCERLDD